MMPSEQDDSGVTREELRERGWSDDIEKRVNRRPQQKINSAERESGGANLTITPAWIYACTECGEERRIAAEDTVLWNDCDNCAETQIFKPLGELVYPDAEES